MMFLAQLDYADIEQYGEGIIYAFICRSAGQQRRLISNLRNYFAPVCSREHLKMSDTSHKESKWHPHLDMSFLGCVLAFAMEVYFEEHIFIPHGGGASFGLIALIVINFMTIP